MVRSLKGDILARIKTWPGLRETQNICIRNIAIRKYLHLHYGKSLLTRHIHGIFQYIIGYHDLRLGEKFKFNLPWGSLSKSFMGQFMRPYQIFEPKY